MDAQHIIAYLNSMGEYEMGHEVLAMHNRLEAFASGLDRQCIDTAIAAEREMCAQACEAKIDRERQQKAEADSRAAESEEAEVARLRHWSDVLLWNRAHEQMAVEIRARSNAEVSGGL